ncbi:MAG: biotin--[acetyl-CoA-carboxylase] ligase [Eubacterium sp.]|nr:biotin--[acetyl-CoA-carboxylase] ligase [Eubacterium sp.]
MSTKIELLKLLDANYGSFVSGESLAQNLGISRAAVNKAASGLKKAGYKILSRPSQGYKLLEKIDILTEEAIGSGISEVCKLTVFDTIDSTNNYAHTLAISDIPQVIVANCQTAGKGRLGRSFISPSGSGIYLTVAFKPSFDLDKSPFITMASALAVCKAIESLCNVSPKIKWVNDIFYRNKKICGILTEAQTNLETGRIDRLLIGIGINCFPGEFPDELANIAGSISDEAGTFSRSKLAGIVIDNILAMIKGFPSTNFLPEYRRKCFVLGKNIYVHSIADGKRIKARALDIDDNGGLVVEYMEGIRMREIETLSSGEVSVRE